MPLDCFGGNHVFTVEHPLPGMTCLCGEITEPRRRDRRRCLDCKAGSSFRLDLTERKDGLYACPQCGTLWRLVPALPAGPGDTGEGARG